MDDFPPIPDFLLRAPRPTREQAEAEAQARASAPGPSPSPSRGRWQKRQDAFNAWIAVSAWLKTGEPTTIGRLKKANPALPQKALRGALRKARKAHLCSLSGRTYTPT